MSWCGLVGSSVVLWFVFVEGQLVWCRLVVPHFNSVAGVMIHEKTKSCDLVFFLSSQRF